MSRALRAANLAAIALVFAFFFIEYAAPSIAAVYWREDYKALMFKCDQAMREHYIAKQAVVVAPGGEAVRNLQAAEVGLLDCHEYDGLRKRMLVWGVSEPKLSSIGLETLESKA